MRKNISFGLLVLSICAVAAVFFSFKSGRTAAGGGGAHGAITLYLINQRQTETRMLGMRVGRHKSDLKEATRDQSRDARSREKIQVYLNTVTSAEESCGAYFKFIEAEKKMLLGNAGLDLQSSDHERYDPQYFTRASYYDVYALADHVQEKQSDSKAMVQALKVKTRELRTNLMTNYFSSANDVDGKPYLYKDPQLNDNVTNMESLRDYWESTGLNYDDREICTMLYRSLTVHENFYELLSSENMLWTDALQLLIEEEKRALNAYDLLGEGIKSKTNVFSNWAFSDVIPVVDGPNEAKAGSTVTLKVFMAGINTDNLPIVYLSESKMQETEGGVSTMKVVIPDGKEEIKYEGEIAIITRSGTVEKRKFTKTIRIVR